MTVHCVAHHPCTDGFAAAWVVFDAHRDDTDAPRFYPYSHGGSWPTLKVDREDTVYFVDVAPPVDVIRSLLKAGACVSVCDHHKSAVEALHGPYSEMFYDSMGIFDFRLQNHLSGAQIAWDVLNGNPSSRPTLIDYVADRDLWKWELPNSREVNAALNAIPKALTYENFRLFDEMMDTPMHEILRTGEAILRVEEEHLSTIMHRVIWAIVTVPEEGLQVRSYRIPVLNCPVFFASEAANRLLKKYPDAPFAACFRIVEGCKREWSLRSEDGRVDVSQVAKAFGGGGHRNAAGFQDSVVFPHIALLSEV